MEAFFLGRAGYKETWELQERLRARVLEGGKEVLLFCEHPPVLTLGRSASPADITVDERTLAERGIEMVRTSRGGQVTYHGPGQLVAYPIVRLRRGIVAHVEWLAAAAVEVAEELGVIAEYRRDHVGVFVGPAKLAAIGVHVSRRVTIHGLALNVTREATAPFRSGWFIPCGDPSGQAISLEEALPPALGRAPELTPLALAPRLAAALCRQAGRPLSHLHTTSPPLLSPDLFVK